MYSLYLYFTKLTRIKSYDSTLKLDKKYTFFNNSANKLCVLQNNICFKLKKQELDNVISQLIIGYLCQHLLFCYEEFRNCNVRTQKKHLNQRRSNSQSKEFGCGHTPKWIGCNHRTIGLRQIEFGIWYFICRRSTSLCRKFVFLCSTISWTIRQT